MKLLPFLSGAVVLGYFVTGLFFLRFWKRMRDELFVAFTLAFWTLGFVEGLLALTRISAEERSGLFLLRLLAFLMILGAIWRKNRRARR